MMQVHVTWNLITVAIAIFISAPTLFAATTTGWQRSIKVEWGYTPPEDVTVTEYRLYQNGKKVCTFLPSTTNIGECTVNLTRTASSFSLAAVFTDGIESPKSADYIFTDLGTGPTMLRMSAKYP